MVNINLAPWRHHQTQQEKKQLLAKLIVTVIIAVSVVVCSHYAISYHSHQQKRTNSRLSEKIDAIAPERQQIKQLKEHKEQLLQRLERITTLYQQRTETVRLFAELATVTPDGMYLEFVERQGSRIELKGSANTNRDVSEFMRRIEHSLWLNTPTLISIRYSDNPVTNEVQKIHLHVYQQEPTP